MGLASWGVVSVWCDRPQTEVSVVQRGEGPRGPAWWRPPAPEASGLLSSPSWAAATGAAASPGVVEPERPQLLFPGQLSWEAQGSLDLVVMGREEVQPCTLPSPSAFQPQMKSCLWRLTLQSAYLLSWVPWCSWKVPRGARIPAPACGCGNSVCCWLCDGAHLLLRVTLESRLTPNLLQPQLCPLLGPSCADVV